MPKVGKGGKPPKRRSRGKKTVSQLKRERSYRHRKVKVIHPNGKSEWVTPHQARHLRTEEWIDYQRYLQSPAWGKLRAQVFARDKCCVKCGQTDGLQAHHLTYERIQRERLTDLVALCDPCHEEIHRSGEQIPTAGMRPDKGKHRKPIPPPSDGQIRLIRALAQTLQVPPPTPRHAAHAGQVIGRLTKEANRRNLVLPSQTTAGENPSDEVIEAP